MCTAATYKTKDFYFGRTLDYDFSYGEEVTVTPRNYPFEFRSMGVMQKHYSPIRERTHNGVVDSIPQTSHQEQAGHPGGTDPQHISAEGEKIGIYEKVYKAAGHIAENIAQFIPESKRTYSFVFHFRFSPCVLFIHKSRANGGTNSAFPVSCLAYNIKSAKKIVILASDIANLTLLW